MLAPKKVKWRKMQKGRRKGTAWRGATLAFGDYGLQAVERGWLTAREIEAAREPPHEAAGSTGHERRRAAHARARARRRGLSPAAQAGDLPAPQPDEGAPDQARPGARQDRAPPARSRERRKRGGRPSARALEPADGVWGARRKPRGCWTAAPAGREHWTGPQRSDERRVGAG